MKLALVMLLALISIAVDAQVNELDSIINARGLVKLVSAVMKNNKKITKVEAETRVIRAIDFKFKATARYIAVKKNCREKIYCSFIKHPKTGEIVLVGGPNAFETSFLDIKTPGEVRILQQAVNLPSEEWVDKKMEEILDGWLVP